MIVLLFFFHIFINPKEKILNTVTSNHVKSDDIPYTKKYPSFGKVSFYAEYLGTVSRTLPELKGEGFLPQDRIPTFDWKTEERLTEDEKNLCNQESQRIITNSTRGASGSYDSIDKEGYLYAGRERVENNRKLYKH